MEIMKYILLGEIKQISLIAQNICDNLITWDQRYSSQWVFDFTASLKV